MAETRGADGPRPAGEETERNLVVEGPGRVTVREEPRAAGACWRVPGDHSVQRHLGRHRTELRQGNEPIPGANTGMRASASSCRASRDAGYPVTRLGYMEVGHGHRVAHACDPGGRHGGDGLRPSHRVHRRPGHRPRGTASGGPRSAARHLRRAHGADLRQRPVARRRGPIRARRALARRRSARPAGRGDRRRGGGPAHCVARPPARRRVRRGPRPDPRNAGRWPRPWGWSRSTRRGRRTWPPP